MRPQYAARQLGLRLLMRRMHTPWKTAAGSPALQHRWWWRWGAAASASPPHGAVSFPRRFLLALALTANRRIFSWRRFRKTFSACARGAAACALAPGWPPIPACFRRRWSGPALFLFLFWPRGAPGSQSCTFPPQRATIKLSHVRTNQVLETICRSVLKGLLSWGGGGRPAPSRISRAAAVGPWAGVSPRAARHCGGGGAPRAGERSRRGTTALRRPAPPRTSAQLAAGDS